MLEPGRNSYAWISNPLDYPGFMEKDENQLEQRHGSVGPNQSFIFPITSFILSLNNILPKLKIKL